jgi:uncharacterized membrane protein
MPAVLRPGAVARLVGAPDTARSRTLTAAVGARELVSAAGLLHPRFGPRFTWTRVMGDAMDLAVLAGTVRRSRNPGRAGATLAVVAGITVVDTAAALLAGRTGTTVELTAATTVRRDPQQVYARWRHLEQLPRFMAHVESVQPITATRSRWTARAPFGRSVTWEAEITRDVPGHALAWRSVDRADVTHAGQVQFVPAPGDQGTEVSVRISYRVPGGRLGHALARWAGEDPHQQLDDDLRRFKQVVETGEVVVSEGAPLGKKARQEFPQHPAQPLTQQELSELAREGVSV